MIPLENTVAGSVKKVYDLMISHDFKIVRSTDVRIEHCLLAAPGTELSDIKEVFSHEQAINQCSAFLRTLGSGVKVTYCDNTAAAAEAVAASGRRDAAAIASHACADLYGLSCLSRSIEDSDNNHTKFVCISKNLEIYPGADRTSLMMVLPHRPGSLYKALSRFYALGVNLLKLESRPIPGPRNVRLFGRVRKTDERDGGLLRAIQISRQLFRGQMKYCIPDKMLTDGSCRMEGDEYGS